VRGLARFAEPWRVTTEGDGIAVCDANGILLVQLSRGGDVDRALRCRDGRLSEAEAAELARLIALLPVLSRRPQY
jgi:hypothetical protein